MAKLTISLVAAFAALLGLVRQGECSALRTVALSGQPSPGAGDGSQFQFFGAPALNQQGETAFFSLLSGSSSTDSSVYREVKNSLTLAAREGTVLGGFSEEVRLGDLGNPAFSGPDGVAFRAQLRGDPASPTNPISSSNNDAIFTVGEVSGLSISVREADAGPSPLQGLTLQTLLSGPRGLPSDSRLAFAASLSGSGTTALNNEAIFVAASGSGGATVVREGDAIVNDPTNVTLSDFNSDFSLSPTGQVAFVGTIEGPGAGDSTNDIIGRAGPGGVEILAREDNTPSTASDVRFSRLNAPPAINAAGLVAFSASESLPVGDTMNKELLVSQRSDGGYQIVAESAGVVPGAPPDVAFGIFFNDVAINADNQVAFTANLVGGSVNASNNIALFAEDAAGELQMIVRLGDAINVALAGQPIDERIVDQLSFLGPGGINDLGQIAFKADFTDGTSGLFVSNVVAVPEPSALVTTLGVLMIGFRSRRGQ